jgi:hypothetical protein
MRRLLPVLTSTCMAIFGLVTATPVALPIRPAAVSPPPARRASERPPIRTADSEYIFSSVPEPGTGTGGGDGAGRHMLTDVEAGVAAPQS